LKFHLHKILDTTLFPAAQTHRNRASGGHTFDVVSNLAWTATEDAAWITITDGASGRDDGTVTYSLAANPSPDLRTGTITVSDGNGISRTFYIQQRAILEIDPTFRCHDAAGSSGHTIDVRGTVVWTAAADDSWIALTSGTSGTDVGVLTYEVAENLALTARDGTITFSGGGITRTVEVHQSGAIPYLEIDPGYAEHGHADSTGHIIIVSANQAWTAVSSESWITLANGGGTGDGTVEYSLDANLNRKSCSGMIMISGGDRTLQFRVTQALSWTVTVSVVPVEGGTAIGDANYGDGAPVLVSVTANPGYTFTNWAEDGVVVSTGPEYSFTAQRSRVLVANLSTHPPEFTSTAVTEATQDVLYTYAVKAADTDDGDILTITAEEKPEWLGFTDHGGGIATLSGTPSNAEVGDHDVVLRVTDITNETVTQEFIITVANVNDSPEFTSEAVTGAMESDLYTYSITTSDPDLVHGDKLTITAETNPGWLTLTDNGDGTAYLSGTPMDADVGAHPVALRVTDLGGLYVTQDFTITVAEAPVTEYHLYLPIIVR
jgi:hypothetical protein